MDACQPRSGTHGESRGEWFPVRMRIGWTGQKKSGRRNAVDSLLVHSQKTKEDAVNYGKLAMLHRLAGNGPIVVYAAEQQENVQKLYGYLQELCNDSRDLKIAGKSILCRNPFLAHHLQEVVRNQTMVPPAPGDSALPGDPIEGSVIIQG